MAVQITKVNLPERTRARFETESNQQRVQKPHDIRSAIPLVDYTNPAKFPPYVFREYPKMPLLDGNAPIIIDESGGVLVFYDAADEVEFKDMNPEIAEEIERNAPAKAYADRIASQESEIEDLRARLRAAGLADEKPVSALAAAVRPAGAGAKTNRPKAAVKKADADATMDVAEPGLRDTLPKAAVNPLKKKH